MNTNQLNKLKLQALDTLNQNQRIALLKHEFKELLDLKNNEIDKITEKKNDLDEIENYLSSKGFYSDVAYARYVTLCDEYTDLEIEHSKLALVVKNVIIRDMVKDVWERFFYLTSLLDIYYNCFIVSTFVPMKDENDDLIYEDSFTVLNERLNWHLDSLIELIYEHIIKTLDKHSKTNNFTIDMLLDLDDDEIEINETAREYYQEVIDGLEKIKDDGFALAKEDNIEWKRELKEEINKNNNAKPSDDNYLEIDNIEPNHKDVIYDMDKFELVMPNEDYLNINRKRDLKYLLMKDI